ncbi:hypothetical protein BGX21_006524, partial [Mortierella sp. AD011]
EPASFNISNMSQPHSTEDILMSESEAQSSNDSFTRLMTLPSPTYSPPMVHSSTDSNVLLPIIHNLRDILNNNSTVRDMLNSHIDWIQSVPITSIRYPNSDKSITQKALDKYIAEATTRVNEYNDIINRQQGIVDSIQKIIDRQISVTTTSTPAPSEHTDESNRLPPKHDKIILPKYFTRYGKEGVSRNVNEFLLNFENQLAVFLRTKTTDLDSTIFGLYLTQAVDDSLQSDRAAFTKSLLEHRDALEPDIMSIPEVKSLFRKHFEKIQSLAEPTKKLLNMYIKDQETFEDYAKRIELE